MEGLIKIAEGFESIPNIPIPYLISILEGLIKITNFILYSEVHSTAGEAPFGVDTAKLARLARHI